MINNKRKKENLAETFNRKVNAEFPSDTVDLNLSPIGETSMLRYLFTGTK